MAVEEGWVLDDLNLNSDAGAWHLSAVSVSPAPRRPVWLETPSADGAALLEDPKYGLRELTYELRMTQQADMDDALDYIAALVDRVTRCSKTPGGLPLDWTPAGATYTATAAALLGEIEDLPVDWQDGWLATAPTVRVKLTCHPFADLAAVEDHTDTFATDTIADYTFDTGGGTLAVSGGQLVPSSTATKKMYYSAGRDLADAHLTVKITTGASVAATKTVGLTGRRIDANNYLLGMVNIAGAASTLTVSKLDAGVISALATSGTFTVATATSYWLRFRLEGNTLTTEWWTAAPTVTGTPAATISHTLAGADLATFGLGTNGDQGIAGKVGLWTESVPTDYRYDDLSIQPNVFVSTSPIQDIVVHGVQGDAPAKGRLIVTDPATQTRRHVEWGSGPAEAQTIAAPLVIDSDSVNVTGHAGTATTRTGAYDPGAAGNSVVRVTLTGNLTSICDSNAALTHEGAYRVRARCYAGSTACALRLRWKVGAGPYQANSYSAAQVQNQFSLYDLGTVYLTPGPLGSHAWYWTLEGYTTDGTATALDFDELELVPVTDGYGVARADIPPQGSGGIVNRDTFQTTGALDTMAADSGGNWSTGPDATDFTVADTSLGRMATRAAVSGTDGRFAVLGSARGDQETQVDVGLTSVGVTTNSVQMGAVCRYVSATSHVRAVLYRGGAIFSDTSSFDLIHYDGTATTIGTIDVSGRTSFGQMYRIILTSWDSGRVIATLQTLGGAVIARIDGVTETVVNGKGGFWDRETAATTGMTRGYDNFVSRTPPTEPVAVTPTHAIEFRHDGVQRLAAGGLYGDPPGYRGRDFYLEPAGDTNRRTRIGVRMARNDLDSGGAYTPLGDKQQVQVLYTPRITVAPRA